MNCYHKIGGGGVYEENDTDNKKLKYTDKQWMTKGLQNACKKKKTLYREFIKHRTIAAKPKYKRYKNKLTNIMRICKNDYYNKIL